MCRNRKTDTVIEQAVIRWTGISFVPLWASHTCQLWARSAHFCIYAYHNVSKNTQHSCVCQISPLVLKANQALHQVNTSCNSLTTERKLTSTLHLTPHQTISLCFKMVTVSPETSFNLPRCWSCVRLGPLADAIIHSHEYTLNLCSSLHMCISWPLLSKTR